MTVITVSRRARVPHTCGRCNCLIAVGERYLYHSLTPRDGDIGNDVWWHSAEHAPGLCESYVFPEGFDPYEDRESAS